MGKAEKKRESWQERKKRIKHKWAKPFIFAEWICERLSYFLGQWALLDICGHIGRFGVLVSIIVGISVYVMEADERLLAQRNQAWQIIAATSGKPGNLGRTDALKVLLKDKVSLLRR